MEFIMIKCSYPKKNLSITSQGFEMCCNPRHNPVKFDTIDDFLTSGSIDDFLAAEHDSCKYCKWYQSKIFKHRTEWFHGINTADVKEDYEYVTVSLSNKCNLKCKTCVPYYSNLHGSKITVITENIQEEILALPNLKCMILMGGEPSYHPELYSNFIKKVNKNVSIHLVSNGTRVSDLLLDALLDHGNFTYSISIDGPSNISEELRIFSTQDVIHNNIKYISNKIGASRCQIAFTPSKDNLHTLLQLYRELVAIHSNIYDFEFICTALIDPPEYRIINMTLGEKQTVINKTNKCISLINNEGLFNRTFIEACKCINELMLS